MNRKNTAPRFVIALAIMLALAIAPYTTSAQNKADSQSSVSSASEEGNPLVGVWQEISVPGSVDCQTGEPGPIVTVAYTFNEGGTMYEEDTLSIDRYRTTGGGIWKRVSGRNYTYVNLHYSFDPNGTFLFTIKQRSNLTLSRDGNSFTEKGTFEGIDPSGNVIFAGCFAATAQRLVF